MASDPPDPPIDLKEELQAACSECGYGIEAWEQQNESSKDRAVTEIDLMREADEVPRRIRVVLTTKGYQVEGQAEWHDTLDNLLKRESATFNTRYNVLLMRKLEDVAKTREWGEEEAVKQ